VPSTNAFANMPNLIQSSLLFLFGLGEIAANKCVQFFWYNNCFLLNIISISFIIGFEKSVVSYSRSSIFTSFRTVIEKLQALNNLGEIISFLKFYQAD
jgi:hypothetical protein